MEQYRALLKTLGGPNPEAPAAAVSERKTFSLQKDWHVLHHALNGTHDGGETILGQAVLGGKDIPDNNQVMGYGPLRYLEPQQVKKVAEALADVDPQRLLSKLNRRDAALDNLIQERPNPLT